jgi:hypothetical protein
MCVHIHTTHYLLGLCELVSLRLKGINVIGNEKYVGMNLLEKGIVVHGTGRPILADIMNSDSNN